MIYYKKYKHGIGKQLTQHLKDFKWLWFKHYWSTKCMAKCKSNYQTNMGNDDSPLIVFGSD